LRTFVTVSFAREFLDTTALLAAYSGIFGPDDDATLVVYALRHTESELDEALRALARESSIADEHVPKIIGVVDLGRNLEGFVRRRAHAVLSSERPGGVFKETPHFGAAEVPALGALAQATWAAPDGWMWHTEPSHDGVISRSPPGDYYSPIPNTPELASEPRRSQIWPAIPEHPPGVDFREEQQIALCHRVFARQERLTFVDTTTDPAEYFTLNDQYPAMDAWVLEAFLRHMRPRRVIEIGAGFSTLVTARVSRELFGGRMRVTCIDPYPRDFLASVPDIDVRVEQVQDSPPSLFETLEAGDILFIDSSHVVKTGSDTLCEYLEILPRLAPGVVVHVHDIFFPRDYPMKWVMEGWGWNEQYLVRAFLTFNSVYRVLWSSYLMFLRHHDVLARAFPGIAHPGYAPGSSLWLQRNGRRRAGVRVRFPKPR
jgi:predicted O-methyltransferase YrrM